ncbi:tetratricopeptide repeat protein [Thalassotalea sp. PLHSN55]|uniref:tetratricopeptide repeat protein n=1 Tax=Thalassotalea sp. PLHSN55 TaxID=3435888 RepID=UPI003F851399
MTFKKILTSAVVVSSLLAAQLPMASTAMAAETKKEEKKKRPTQLVGQSVGKKVAKAFELYSADDIDGALVVLLDIEAKKDYDKAYVARFIAVMYATKGDEKKAIDYLKQAVAPDILNEGDHGEALKLLADLQMQGKDYKEALKNYQAWMDFTGKSDGNTWVKIGQAYSELKQLDKVIAPADKAIAAFGDKQNQNPYVLKIQSYYERKKYKEAIDVLETVLQVFPENKTWWTQLGMFHLLVEDYKSGLEVLSLAYKQGFLDKESQIKTLASLYSSNEVPHKAAMLLEKHIDSGLVTRDDSNVASLANAWHAALEIDKAAKYYGELAKMTNDAKYYRKQGMLLKQDEQFKKAIVALNKALEIDKKDAGRVHMSLAESYFYLENYKLAYSNIKKAQKDPKTKRAASGWVGFIKDTAERKGKSL